MARRVTRWYDAAMHGDVFRSGEIPDALSTVAPVARKYHLNVGRRRRRGVDEAGDAIDVPRGKEEH